MRKINFRAWIKNKKEIHKVESLNLRGNGSISAMCENNGNWSMQIFSFNQIELMQYIGFHDKNGKSIYEGDIVEYEDYGTGERCYSAVEYDEDNACFYITLFGNEYNQLTDDICCLVKAVGNIYENPELLEVVD